MRKFHLKRENNTDYTKKLYHGYGYGIFYFHPKFKKTIGYNHVTKCIINAGDYFLGGMGLKKEKKRYWSLIFMFAVGMYVMYMIQTYGSHMQASTQQEMALQVSAAKESIQEDDLSAIFQVYDLISKGFFKDVDKDDLINGAIKGMVDELDDPHSFYMSQDKATQFMQSVDGEFEGIGAEVSMKAGKLYIIAPIKNSPAEQIGLKPRDQILKINGESIEGLTQSEAILKIRGKKGTKVTLQILREGSKEPIDFEVIRGVISQITVEDQVMKENGKNLVSLHITTFSENTVKEFSSLLQKYEKEGMDGLILDVRGNPGGYLNSVEEMLNMLVTNEKPIVMLENRAGDRQEIRSTLTTPKKYPISILIDEGSASASEIMAAALKEIGNYPVIGMTSYGKGTVQQGITVKNGNMLKLTTSKWLTPNGNWVNEKGVTPTIEVKQPDYFYLVPLTLSKNEQLKYDMNSEKVQIAQKSLRALGFNPQRFDGYFSKDTKNAVMKFQKSTGLSATGVINEATAAKIYKELVKMVQNKDNDLQLQKAIEVMAK